MIALHIAVGLLPVMLYLVGLRFMDSFKLVHPRDLALVIGAGAVVAVMAYYLNSGLREGAGLPPQVLTRYVGPLAEEVLKGAVVLALLARNRVGFLVDAAILGFAVGAGFAFVENLYFLGSRDLGLWTWVVRGLGTAVMHGGATAVFAILSKLFLDRRTSIDVAGVLPALLAATVLHSAYNHFFLPPIISAALMSLSAPLLVALVFSRSEAATRSWISDGFDADQELMRLMQTGELSDSRIGRYLAELKVRFPGEVLMDMLCLLRLEVELSIRAKGILMMREAGFEPKPDEALKAKVAETRFLEESIGATGLRALAPFLRIRGRDQWQRQVLGVR